jgi:uncharacterized protein (TIGR02246 family)
VFHDGDFFGDPAMDEAYAVVKQWEAAFNAGDADAVTALYAPSATLWGTLAQDITTTTADIRSYFVQAARAGLKVKLGPHVLLPMAEAGVIDAGHYEFSRIVDGRTTAFPARYSFVLTKHNGAWAIAHQHSSFMPKPAGG